MKKRQQLGVTDLVINIEDNERFVQTGHRISQSYIKAYLRHFLPRVPEEAIE